MAVDVRIPTNPTPPEFGAYLREAAATEKALLDEMMAKQQLEEQPTIEATQAIEPMTGTLSGITSPLTQSYPVTQKYGNYNPQLYSGRTVGSRHYGLDVGTPEGTEVRSPFAGVVKVGSNKDFGNFVEIRTKDGDIMRFSHLNNIEDLVSQLGQAGREIGAGQLLGKTGRTGYTTGPHLDIMYQRGGQWVDPREFEPLKRTLGG